MAAQAGVYAQYGVTYTALDTTWIAGTNRFVTVGQHVRGAGVLAMYKLLDANIDLVQEAEPPKPTRCVARQQGATVAVGSFGGALQLWDLTRMDTPKYEVKADEALVNAVDCAGSNENYMSEIVVGTRSGHVLVYDSRQDGKPVAEINPPAGKKRDCWAVKFAHDIGGERSVCAGFDSGELLMVDLRTMRVHWSDKLASGICSLSVSDRSSDSPLLAVSGLDGLAQVYDIVNKQPTARAAIAAAPLPAGTAARKPITRWRTQFAPKDPDTLLFFNSDGAADISSRKKDAPVWPAMARFQISKQAVSSFDCSPDGVGLLVSTCFDRVLRAITYSRN